MTSAQSAPVVPPPLQRGTGNRKGPEDPQTYKEAMSCTDRGKWVDARKKEMVPLLEEDVFELVPLPKGKHAIVSKLAYRIKVSDGVNPP